MTTHRQHPGSIQSALSLSRSSQYGSQLAMAATMPQSPLLCVTGRAVEADQTLLSQAGNAPNFDFILSSSFVNFNPVNVTVNGDTCAVIISSNITNQPLPNVTTNANVTGVAETESAAGLTTSNGQITDYNGNVIVFKGLNWFGFDDGNTGPDGLWAGSTSLTQDFANIMLRIKALGFNAVRLPFSFKVICLRPLDAIL